MFAPQISGFSGESADQVDYRGGALYGVGLNFAAMRNFSIEPQFLISENRAAVTIDETTTDFDIQYARLGVIFKTRIPLGGKLYPVAFIGPYGARTLNSNVTQNYQGDDTAPEQIALKKGDGGLTYGFGVDWVHDRFYLALAARCDQGIARIGNAEYTPDLKLRSYALMGSFGFVIAR